MIGLGIKAAAGAFGAAGLVTKLIVIAALLGTLATAYGVWHHRVYQRGVSDTIAAVARADAKVVARAQKARQAWRSCRDLGKQWDQTTGGCQ